MRTRWNLARGDQHVGGVMRFFWAFFLAVLLYEFVIVGLALTRVIILETAVEVSS
jgi:hypothetical protein